MLSIKSSEAFLWGLRGKGTYTVFLGIMALSLFLTIGVKTVVMWYFWKTH